MGFWKEAKKGKKKRGRKKGKENKEKECGKRSIVLVFCPLPFERSNLLFCSLSHFVFATPSFQSFSVKFSFPHLRCRPHVRHDRGLRRELKGEGPCHLSPVRFGGREGNAAEGFVESFCGSHYSLCRLAIIPFLFFLQPIAFCLGVRCLTIFEPILLSQQTFSLCVALSSDRRCCFSFP